MLIGITDNYTTASLIHLKDTLKCQVEKGLPKEAEALLIRSRTHIDEKFLKLHPKLKVVVSATSGFDHIDIEACRKQNVTAMYTPEANAQSAAELTLLLMLSALRRMTETQKLMRAKQWKDELKLGSELNQKTVGVIGLGRVGSKVARLAKAFGAEVLAHDPYQDDKVFDELKIKRLSLTEVLVQSQILTLHVPLTSETRHMINHVTLKQMPTGAILINASRGKVVDETALMDALSNGDLQAAALDVFENEPLQPKAKLREFPNVFLTPHIGAFTEEALAKASMDAVQHLIDFVQNGTVRDEVPAP